jgi:hypothetical protein
VIHHQQQHQLLENKFNKVIKNKNEENERNQKRRSKMKKLLTTLLVGITLATGLFVSADETNPDLYKYNGHLAILSFQSTGTTNNLTVVSDQDSYDAPGTSSLVNVEVKASDSSKDIIAHDSDAGRYWKLNDNNNGTLAGYVKTAKGTVDNGISAEKIAKVISGTDSGPFINAYSFATKSEQLSGCYQNYDGRTWIYNIIKNKNSGWLCTLQQGSASFDVFKPVYGTEITAAEYRAAGGTIS